MTLERLDELERAIRGYSYRYVTEDDLQQGLTLALEHAGFSVLREVRLDARCRIDLLVDRIGIEVKIAGTAADLRRQAARYLAFERLDALIVVTSRVRHVTVSAVDGKPVRVVSLAGAGL